MSGGSKKKRRGNYRNGRDDRTRDEESPDDPALTAYSRAPTQRTFQPMPPGGLDLLAQQLQSGYGGDMTGYLDSLYQPMTLQQFQEPISVTKSQYKAGDFAPIETGNSFLDQLLMGQIKPSSEDDRKKKKDRDDGTY